MANSYVIIGSVLTQRNATDPVLCRISGYVKNVFSLPEKAVSITVRHVYKPLAIATDTLVVAERALDILPDKTGYLSFDVYQGARIRVELKNRPDLFFEVDVPEASSVDLVDLLLPYVAQIDFVESGPVLVGVGDLLTVLTVATLSNGKTVTGSIVARLESSDPEILSSDSAITFLARSTGTVTLSVSEVNSAVLGLNTQPNGDVILRLQEPSAILPAPLTVQVV